MVTEVFADLNGRDKRGLYSALIEDADGPVSVGAVIRVVDDEDSRYDGRIVEIVDGLMYFSLEPGTARRVRANKGQYVLA